MKRIIMVKSSGTDYGVEERNQQKSIFDLQIVLRIARLLGGKLPESQFETVKLDCGFSERRKIRRRAKKSNTWMSLLKMGEGEYFLLTQSIKIAGNKTKPLTQQEMLSCLAETEVTAEKRANSLWAKLKRVFGRLKNKVKEMVASMRRKISSLLSGKDDDGW